MRRIKAAAVAAACLFAFGCDGPHQFPDMPVVPKGTGFQATEGFSTDKMLGMCAAANTAAGSGSLSGMSDRQIANGTCEFGAIAVELIGRGADPDQTCVAADAAMIKEFGRRFPDHDPKDVIGRC